MNSVPAAAVIRGGQALFGITGRKGHVGCQSPPLLEQVLHRVQGMQAFSLQALHKHHEWAPHFSTYASQGGVYASQGDVYASPCDVGRVDDHLSLERVEIVECMRSMRWFQPSSE